MIEKIKYIQNVGKFHGFSGQHDELSLKKYTFIYGGNTKGKTTLASIFKSLSTQNPDILFGRKTFGSSGEQKVILETADIGNIQFDGKLRNATYKIKIFDNEYIHKNIYSEEVVDEDKQQNMLRIMVGEQGQLLESEYNERLKDCNINSNEKKSITLEYNKIFGNHILDFSGFMQLKENENIDNEIEILSQKLSSYDKQSEIKNTINTFLKNLNFNISKIELSKTLSISQDIFEKHIKNNISGGEQEGMLKFIEFGYNHTLEKCPYCGQDMDDSHTSLLIESYNEVLSDQYKKLNNTIALTIQELNEQRVGKLIRDFEKAMVALGVKYEAPTRDILEENIEVFKKELQKKQQNLNYNINFKSLEQLTSGIKNIKRDVNELLLEYKEEIKKDIILEDERQLEILKLTKARFGPTWSTKCNDYLDLKNIFEHTLKPAEDIAFNNVQKYRNDIMGNYENIINPILDDLNAGFHLCNFTIPSNRREKIKLFGIKFTNTKTVVDLEGDDQSHNFKNTLSESDKRLLAFAFFVAEIQQNGNIEQFVIILDDPVSSLDNERKLTTAQVIKECFVDQSGQSPQQVIVLTHEEKFLQYIYKKFSRNETNEKKYLEIHSKEGEEGKSTITTLDMIEFNKGKHMKRLEKINQYVDKKILDYSLNEMREILEYIIKAKYYHKFKNNTISGGKIIGRYCEESDIPSEKVIRVINDLFIHLFNHDDEGEVIREEELSNSDKRKLASDLLTLIPDI